MNHAGAKENTTAWKSVTLQSLLLVLVGCVTIGLTWHLRLDYPFDDSFITFRYVEHLAHGAGLVWNIGGAHTEGYTNFFYIILLAPSYLFRVDTLTWSQLLNLAAYLISAVLIFRIASRAVAEIDARSRTVAPFLLAVLFLVTPLVWMNAYSAMETSVFGALLLAAVYFFPERIILSYLFATTAALTRPEGTMLGIIFAVVCFVESKGSARWRPALLYFVLPLALYHLWRVWYFGNILPNSFVIKVLNPNEHGGTIFHGRAYVEVFLLSTLAIALAALLALRYYKTSSLVRVILIWTAAVLGFYLLPEALMGLFDRFLYSAEVFLFVLAAVGLGIGLQHWKLPAKIAVIAILVLLHGERSFRSPRALEARGSSDDTYRRYTRVAEVLRELPDHESISFGFADAGIIPFFSYAKNVDLVGLNDNRIARARTLNALLETIEHDSLDMIFVPLDLPRPEDDSCRHVFRAGHGLIGAHYLDLVRDPRFSDYRTLVQIHTRIYDVAVMENIRSQHAREIEAAFQTRLLQNDTLFLPPPKCLN